MTPEEYERIKEAEKDHLRKLKKLKEAHRQLQRQARVTKAVTDMTSSMQEKLDVHADMMDRIATESAINEARLEMAIESRQTEDLETQALEDELELTRAKARDLIRKLKEEPEERAASKAPPRASNSDEPTDRRDSTADKPSGSTPAASPTAGDDLPEKTIGRMKH
jgi:hypothetical protein